MRPTAETEALHAGSDRTGGYQYHLDATRPQLGDLLHPTGNSRRVQTETIVGQQSAADFHHTAARLGQEGSLCVHARKQFSCASLYSIISIFTLQVQRPRPARLPPPVGALLQAVPCAWRQVP